MTTPPPSLTDLILSFAPDKPLGKAAQHAQPNMLGQKSAFAALQKWWNKTDDNERVRQLGAALRNHSAVKPLLFRGDTALGLWFMLRASEDPLIASWMGKSALRTVLDHAAEVLRTTEISTPHMHADLLLAHAKLVSVWAGLIKRNMTTTTWSNHLRWLLPTLDEHWKLLSANQQETALQCVEKSMTTAATKMDRPHLSELLNDAMRRPLKIKWLTWRLNQGDAMDKTFPKSTCVYHLQHHRFFTDVLVDHSAPSSLDAFHSWMTQSAPQANRIVGDAVVNTFAAILSKSSTDPVAWLKALRSGPLPIAVQDKMYPDTARMVSSLRESILQSIRNKNAPADDLLAHQPMIAHVVRTLEAWRNGLPAADQDAATIQIVRSIQRDVLKSVNCVRTAWSSPLSADSAAAITARALAIAPSFRSTWTTQAPRILNLKSSMDRLCGEQQGEFDAGLMAQVRSLLAETPPRVQATLEMILALQNDQMEIPSTRPICLHAASWSKRSRNPERQKDIRARWEAQAEAAAISEKLSPDELEDTDTPTPPAPRRRM